MCYDTVRFKQSVSTKCEYGHTSDCREDLFKSVFMVRPTPDFLPDIDVSDVEWVVVAGHTSEYPVDDWARKLIWRCDREEIPNRARINGGFFRRVNGRLWQC